MLIDEANSSGMERVLQNLYGSFIREIEELERGKNGESRPVSLNLEVSRDGKVIYEGSATADGKITGGANGELAARLEILRSLPVGTVVASVPNFQVELETRRGDGTREREIILATDKGGRIWKNASDPGPSLSGFEVVERNLASIARSPENLNQLHLLNQQLRQMREALEIQRMTTELIASRLEKPRETDWWARLSERVNRPLRALGEDVAGAWRERVVAPVGRLKELLENWREALEYRRGARSLRALFERETHAGATVHEGDYYRLDKIKTEIPGKRYGLSSKTGEKLMEFHVHPLGTIEPIGSSELDPTLKRDLSELERALRRNEPAGEGFMSISGRAESKHRRTEKLIGELVALARRSGKTLEKKGDYYNLKVEPSGSASVEGAGRGLLYLKAIEDKDVIVINRFKKEDIQYMELELSRVREAIALQENSLAADIGPREKSRGGR